MPAEAAKPPKPSKPGAPTITAVAAGVKSVRVFFTKPADNGGSKIVNYRVVCKSTDGGRKGANEGYKSPIKIGGLNAGKTYTCTVAARNKVGLGTPSAPSDPFVPKPTPKKP
jgi:titin